MLSMLLVCVQHHSLYTLYLEVVFTVAADMSVAPIGISSLLGSRMFSEHFRDLVDMMPALILHHSAVDKLLLVRLEQTVSQKTGIATLATNLEESHKMHFWNMASR